MEYKKCPNEATCTVYLVIGEKKFGSSDKKIALDLEKQLDPKQT